MRSTFFWKPMPIALLSPWLVSSLNHPADSCFSPPRHKGTITIENPCHTEMFSIWPLRIKCYLLCKRSFLESIYPIVLRFGSAPLFLLPIAIDKKNKCPLSASVPSGLDGQGKRITDIFYRYRFCMRDSSGNPFLMFLQKRL
jgi:hypothetical protein